MLHEHNMQADVAVEGYSELLTIGDLSVCPPAMAQP